MDIYTVLVIVHIIGTILGVGAATFIEVHLNMALKDGTMDPQERVVMGYDFLISRIGLAISFLSGIGFLWLYAVNDQWFRIVDGVFWAKMAIIMILIINAYLLHKHKIGLYWGSAFSFVSWWSAMLLGMFLSNTVKIMPAEPILSFMAIMAVYGAVVVAGAFVLDRIRKMTAQPKPSNETSQ